MINTLVQQVQDTSNAGRSTSIGALNDSDRNIVEYRICVVQLFAFRQVSTPHAVGPRQTTGMRTYRNIVDMCLFGRLRFNLFSEAFVSIRPPAVPFVECFA